MPLRLKIGGQTYIVDQQFFHLVYRGKGCEAFIRISRPFTSMSVRRNNQQEDTEEVELICSPATRRIYDGQGR